MFTTQKNDLNTKNNVWNSQNWTLLTGSLIYCIIAVILWRYFLHVEVWLSAPQVCVTIKLLQAITNTRLGGSIDFNGAVLTAKCLFLKTQVSAEASISVCQRIKLTERKRGVKWSFLPSNLFLVPLSGKGNAANGFLQNPVSWGILHFALTRRGTELLLQLYLFNNTSN